MALKDLLKKIVIRYRILRKGTPITLKDLAKLLDASFIGNGNTFIKGIVDAEFAKEGDIAFAMDGKDLDRAKTSKASCIITMMDIEKYPKPVLKVKDIKYAMTVIYNALQEVLPPQKGGIHPTAVISGKARIGRNVKIGPYAIVQKNAVIGDNSSVGAHSFIGEDVKIGSFCAIYPNVTLYDQTVIGNRCAVHSGTVIGADGFGYIPKDGKIYKVPQAGHVILKNNVEIGSNTCIDRGTFTNTVIEENSKIDNLVQIGHNVKVDRNVFIAGLTGVSGSCAIGENTMIGGGVGIADHVAIGKNVKVGGRTGVHGDVEDGKTIFLYPYREEKDAKQLYAIQSYLIKYGKKLRKFMRGLPE